MKELIVMIGLPCSGKSTYINNGNFYNLRDETSVKDYTYIVLSTDDYIEQKAQELGSTYTNVFHEYIKEAESNLKHRLNEAVDNGYNIVWDQTNLRTKKRATILSSVPSDYKKIAIEFITPMEVILERNKSRAEATGKFIAEHIIKSMNDSKEHVSENEGFDEIITIRYNEPEV